MSEEIADSWEDLENGEDLDKKLDKLVQPVKLKDQSNCIPKLHEEIVGCTPYQPTIKILKRETNNTQNNCRAQESKIPTKPIKTYEEREAAYAEARLRILGSAVNPEEENPSLDGLDSGSQSNSSTSTSISSSSSSNVRIEQIATETR